MKIDKVIFLDIDGVLALANAPKTPKSEWVLDFANPFDKVCVQKLNKILTETQAEIILSSEWRHDYTMDELDIIFKWNKSIKSPIAITTDEWEFDRCRQIKTFLDEHTVNKFTIIDDMVLDCFPDQFILTIPEIGITNDVVKRAISMLNKE